MRAGNMGKHRLNKNKSPKLENTEGGKSFRRWETHTYTWEKATILFCFSMDIATN